MKSAKSKNLKVDKATIPNRKAAKFVKNYLQKRKGLSSTLGDDNTNFLFISIKKLVEIINEWNGEGFLSCKDFEKSKVDEIRIYPMIYSKKHNDADRRNKLNLCLVPAKAGSEIISDKDDNNLIKSFEDIENDLGQCPPMNCNGATLLNMARELMEDDSE